MGERFDVAVFALTPLSVEPCGMWAIEWYRSTWRDHQVSISSCED